MLRITPSKVTRTSARAENRVSCVDMCVTVGSCAGECPGAVGMLDSALQRAGPVENTVLARLVKACSQGAAPGYAWHSHIGRGNS